MTSRRLPGSNTLLSIGIAYAFGRDRDEDDA